MSSTKTVITEQPFPLKPCSAKEIAKQYGITYYVFRKWLKPFEKELGKPICRLYNIEQVKKIYAKCGLPGQVVNERT